MYSLPLVRRRVSVFVSIVCLVSALPVGASQSVVEDVGLPNDPRPAICFAPGTPEEVVEAAYQRVKQSYERNSLTPFGSTKFQIQNRWTSTATNGSGLSDGDPTTLTWSVVPDGTGIAGGYGEPAAPSDLRAFLTGIYGSEPAWLAVMQQVFDRWSAVTGITYVYEPNDDGADISYSWPGSIGVRGDIRISGHYIDGDSGVLAYNYYPNGGDMVIDTDDSYYSNTGNNSLAFRNVLAHEHGHGLGLDHSCPRSQTKLMEPFITFAFDGPQHDDILAANRSYGDRYENDDTAGAAAAIGLIGSTTLEDISIDDNSDVDFYSFTVAAGANLDLTLTPIGSTYLSGPQNPAPTYTCTAGTNYDSLRIQDLAVRVLDVNGSSELESADAAGVGVAETISGLVLPSGAGTYFVEVTGDSANEAQLYELSLSVSPSDSIFFDGFEGGNTNQWD